MEVAFHNRDLETIHLELGDNKHHQVEEASCKEEANNNCTHRSTGQQGEVDSNSFHKLGVNAIGFQCDLHRSLHLRDDDVHRHRHHHNSLHSNFLNPSLLMFHHLSSELRN